MTETLTNSDGTVPAHLQPLAVALTSMPRANSGYVWIRSPRVQTLLRALAANQVALTHSALDELPHSRTVEYLRGLLITHGLLPTRDYHLAAFERWLAAKLEQLTNTDHHQLIYRYARWHLLPRLRQQARTGPVSASAFLTTKQSTTAAIRFLAWLDAHGTALHDATQHHLDRWFAEGPTTRLNADRFVRWAIKHRLLRHLRATKSTGRSSPVLSEQQRREHLRRVLLDDTVTISHRVIAVLVLLFGQPISRIVQLHTDDVIIDGDRTLLRLAHDPLEVPQPAATLLRNYLADPRYRRNTAAQPDTPWLFPGVMPGRPIHIHRAAKALRDLGIPPGAARAGTWLHLVRQAPPPVLAEALGISPETAMRHASRAGADYLGYPTRTQAPSATTS